MLKELLKDILQLQRPETINKTVYGNYEGNKSYSSTYSDKEKEYEYEQSSKSITKVHSKNAFTAFIKEELNRRENKTGKFATARVTLDGGFFTADDNYNIGKCEYSRLNSEQYNILKGYKNSVLDHEEFLTMLQKLKPSIENFAELYTRCSKIRVVGRSIMTNQPMFDEDGNAESSFVCTYKLEDGTDEDVSLPTGFVCSVPFAKAGEQEYTYNVELLMFNTNSNQIAIKVQIPEWETNEEQAVIDEADDIKKELENIEDILILADF